MNRGETPFRVAGGSLGWQVAASGGGWRASDRDTMETGNRIIGGGGMQARGHGDKGHTLVDRLISGPVDQREAVQRCKSERCSCANVQR